MRAQKRILIVLEDVATLDRLGAHLSDQGFDIRYAGSPAEALALNHDWNADLVIATYESGQGNGVTERDIEKTLLDRLRSQYSGSRYLLIVALGQTPRNLRGMKDTVIAFLGSPFTPEDLMYYVRSALMNEPVGHANRREHARHTFNIESHCVLINPFNNTESRPMPLLMRDLSRSGFSMIVRQMLPVPAMIKIVISLSDQTHPLVMLAKTLTCTLTQIEKVYRVGARFVGLLPEQLDKVILQLNENGGAERDTDIYMGKSFKQAVEDWLTQHQREVSGVAGDTSAIRTIAREVCRTPSEDEQQLTAGAETEINPQVPAPSRLSETVPYGARTSARAYRREEF